MIFFWTNVFNPNSVVIFNCDASFFIVSCTVVCITYSVVLSIHEMKCILFWSVHCISIHFFIITECKCIAICPFLEVLFIKNLNIINQIIFIISTCLNKFIQILVRIIKNCVWKISCFISISNYIPTNKVISNNVNINFWCISLVEVNIFSWLRTMNSSSCCLIEVNIVCIFCSVNIGSISKINAIVLSVEIINFILTSCSISISFIHCVICVKINIFLIAI